MSLTKPPAGLPTATRARPQTVRGRPAPATLETCLAVSPIEARRRLIRGAIEKTAWEAIVVDSARELLRAAFLHRAALVWVDLPAANGGHDDEIAELQSAATAVREATKGLLVVSTSSAADSEECWARSQGAWAYLPDVAAEEQFRIVLNDAIEALKRCRERGQPRAGFS